MLTRIIYLYTLLPRYIMIILILNFCLTFQLISWHADYPMIPWLLCIQVYCVVLLHLFISTNSTCAVSGIVHIHSPFEEVFVLNLYQNLQATYSVICFIYTYFHSIDYSVPVSYTCLYTFLILVCIQTAGSDETHSPAILPLLPTAHPFAKTWYVFIMPNKFLGYVLSLRM